MENKIYNECCTVTMAKMPDSYLDLTVTSPPYDNLRCYNGYTFSVEKVATYLLRVSKPGAVVVWITGDQVINGSETGTSFRQALAFMASGWRLHDTMIYEKDSISFPETTRYSQVFEYMFIFSKGQPKTVNIIKDKPNKWAGCNIKGRERQKDGSLYGRRKGNELQQFGSRYNIWRIPAGHMKSTKDSIAYQHPAIFPEQLAKDHIYSWSNAGDIVYDPFAGSGTTAKMAASSGRKFICSEISAEYCQIIRKRVDPVLRQQVIF